MTSEMWVALGILVAAIILFVSERLRVGVVAIAVMVALMLTGLLTAQEAIAASMAFASPVASPAYTLVMGAGHYHFSDYMKVDRPLIFITLLVAMLVLPLIFPF